ncbi:MAG: flavin reductase family protein [Lautropia sp.]|nr:flavin reductase family protein [Lautropia sp.]
MNQPAIVEVTGAGQAPDSQWGSVDLAPATLRKLFGCYPTGVAIVTTRAADGRKVGLTINSFASLSLDPPLVLWSLVNHSPSLDVFRDSRHFAINVLASSHEDLARRFANPAIPDKFADVDVQETPEGVPAIEGALTTLVCAHDHCRTVGDHLLLIGRIVRTASQPNEPLVFHGGRFVSVQAPA